MKKIIFLFFLILILIIALIYEFKPLKIDTSECDKITIENSPHTLTLCYANLAIEYSNKKVCNLLSKSIVEKLESLNKESETTLYKKEDINQKSTEHKELCKAIFISKTSKNLRDCNSLNQSLIDSCKLSILINKGDPSKCIESEINYFYISTCFNEIAIKNKDLNICSNFLPNTNKRIELCKGCNEEAINYDFESACIHSFALRFENSSICDLSLEPFKSNCYFDISRKTHEIENCMKIQSNLSYFGTSYLMKEVCIMEIAIFTKNKSICDILTPVEPESLLGMVVYPEKENSRQDCYKKIGVYESSIYYKQENSTNKANLFKETFEQGKSYQNPFSTLFNFSQFN